MIFNSLINNRSNFIKSVLILMSGVVAGKLLSLLFLPLLTRLYSPVHFGQYALFKASYLFLVPLLTFKLEIGIPLASSARRLINLVRLTYLLIFLNTIIIWLLLAILPLPDIATEHFEFIRKNIFIVVVAAMIQGLYEITYFYFVRRRKFKILAVARFVGELSGNSLKTIAGIFSYYFGLVLGQILQVSVDFIILLVNSKSRIKLLFKYPIYVADIRQLIAEVRSISLNRVPASILLIAAQQLPVFTLSLMYGDRYAGYFSLALIAVSLPLGMLGGSLGKVLYAEFANINFTKNVKNSHFLLVKTQKRLFFIGLLFLIVLIPSSLYLFPVFFGDQWVDAGNFVAILTVPAVFQAMSAPLMQTLNVTSNQSLFLKINLFRVSTFLAVTFAALSLNLTAIDYMIGYAIFMSLFYAVCVNIVFNRSKKFSFSHNG